VDAVMNAALAYLPFRHDAIEARLIHGWLVDGLAAADPLWTGQGFSRGGALITALARCLVRGGREPRGQPPRPARMRHSLRASHRFSHHGSPPHTPPFRPRTSEPSPPVRRQQPPETTRKKSTRTHSSATRHSRACRAYSRPSAARRTRAQPPPSRSRCPESCRRRSPTLAGSECGACTSRACR
jgi:hypothetical protein